MASTAAGDIIKCPCSSTSETDPRKFVQCAICSTWQHLLCMGLPLKDSDLPDRYYCHICQPTEHPLLMTYTAQNKVGEVMRMRNECAKIRPRGRPSLELKRDWMVLECLALVRRLSDLKQHWATHFTGDPAIVTTNGDADANTKLQDHLRRAVDLVVRYSKLPILEDLRAGLVRKMHQSEAEQVGVLWSLRDTFSSSIFVTIECHEEDEEAAADLVIWYFDCRRDQGIREPANPVAPA